MLGAFSSFALAQEAAQPATADEEKTELYRKYYETAKSTPEQQKAGYEIAKEYLKKYGADSDAYTLAVKKWAAKYEAESRVVEFNQPLMRRTTRKFSTWAVSFSKSSPKTSRSFCTWLMPGLSMRERGIRASTPRHCSDAEIASTRRRKKGNRSDTDGQHG